MAEALAIKDDVKAVDRKSALSKLSPRQRRFVIKFANQGFRNAAKAYSTSGWSKKACAQGASRELRKPEVRAAIHALMPELISPDRIQRDHFHIIDGDMADFEPLCRGVGLKALRDSGVDTKLIKKFRCVRRVVGEGDDSYNVEDIQIELYDRQTSLRDLSRVIGLSSEGGTSDGLNIQINVAVVNSAKKEHGHGEEID